MRSILALLALPAATLAVSLVDFPPRVTGLSSSCQSVYTQVIDGCSNSDFASAKSCSPGCIDALQAMTGPVQQACSSDTNVGGTVINAFLHNAGTGAICGNAASVLATMSSAAPSSTVAESSSAAPTSSVVSSAALMSTTAASSSAVESTISSSDSTDSTADSSTSSEITTSSSSIILSGTSTASPLATTTATSTATASHTTSSALIVDTSSSPSSSSHKPSATGNSQNGDNSNSGGGSPFDSISNQASAGNALEVLSYGVAGICGLVFAMVWL
ncbi:hypothetical protein LTR78_000478 [Recurvomyces mirabilis]|uniref:Uncharacterized protein n=1 Tax=Recurvomyces mirabilis TaxID=574656 RepID=A0AAE0WY61_9PEZI|nr:hypothetical protein LTR78_000478 [Recurvomyces mirabilis]KAK5162133.1 hypothetical protein LTS14_000479 [Recurvomyces mirabilis]